MFKICRASDKRWKEMDKGVGESCEISIRYVPENDEFIN